jgi:hypothetical protein
MRHSLSKSDREFEKLLADLMGAGQLFHLA